MNLRAIVGRLDDWMNPIVVKELRQAVQSRLVVAILLLALGLEVFILGTALIFREANQATQPTDWHAGAQIFLVFQGILLFCCLLLIPAYTGVRLAAERSDSNTDLLFITSLRPRSIIWGKFVAALVLAVLLFSACAPFMTLSYLLRGIDIPTILFLLAVDLVAVIVGTQVALFLAAVPAPRALKVLLHLVEIFVLGWIFVALVGTANMLLRFGIGAGEDPVRFYGLFATAALAALSLGGLFFCWSVAIISPPPSNRAPAGRAFLLAMWLVLGVAAAVWSRRELLHGPVLLWLIFGVGLGCLQFFISINERERWAARVARQIPRNWLLRPLAFLFYSGAAGGLTLAVVMVGLTIGATNLWRWRYPTYRSAEEIDHVSLVMLVAALYVFCYGLSGVLLRRYLLSDRIRATFTWLVALLLVGLGSSVPAVIAYIGFSDEIRYGTNNPWWLLSNPFASVYDISHENLQGAWSTFTTWCFTFTLTWTAVVAGLCAPWYFAQVVRFRPPPRDANPGKVELLEALPADAAPVKAG